jgi:hypothetical protein
MRKKARRTQVLISSGVLLILAGCSGSKAGKPAGGDTSASEGSMMPAATSTAAVPQACTLFTRSELEPFVGWKLDEGNPRDAQPGSFNCDFKTPEYSRQELPNPALPKSVGFSSLTVNTHTADPKAFEDFRKTLGSSAHDAPGIGDGAYFYGSDMLYVRVGNRGFSLRIYTDTDTDELSDSDKALVRDVMMKIAKAGVSKLT